MPVFAAAWTTLAIALLAARCAVAAPADPPPAGDVRPADEATARTGPTAADPAADELLARLERSHQGVRGFSADLRVFEIDDLLGRTEIRYGDLLYKLTAEPAEPGPGPAGSSSTLLAGKRFSVRFHDLIVGGERSTREEAYVFDGRWLYEIDPAKRQMIAREVVPPGRTLDPLKLGEGPFPLPVGQSRAEVLARFEVASAPAPTEGPLSALEDVVSLRLTPRPGRPEAESWEALTLHYDRATLLPVGVEAVEPNGDRQIVRLSNLVRDPVYDRAAIDRLLPPATDESWLVDVRPWQGGEDPDGAGEPAAPADDPGR